MSEIHRIKCGNGNCYIVENGTNGILVDTGKKEFMDKVIHACRSYNVKMIVLTHAHFDHAENAAQISDKLGIPIGMNGKDCNLIRSNTNQSLSAAGFLGKIVLSASLKEFAVRAMPEFKPAVLLNHDDNLSDYGIDARIIALSGHTDGSIGIDVEHKHLIVGDALMNMFYPTVSMLYHNRDNMLESARKIGDMGSRIIYFGHGKPVPNKRWVK
ncbi:MBL fold metallo-hydrolase [Parablautia muri]|uniref:MBL fold metallo-hydrolase n=1 Tax=Parablautia muri TaxID=2320879 RepID=A0A9X5GTG7_9FIRM|nr:MBL fold metallo-hydrolase [Parablautia muri]NBJ92967.1 MBL fold metallo-hydrolase [Parablautia muri]